MSGSNRLYMKCILTSGFRSLYLSEMQESSSKTQFPMRMMAPASVKTDKDAKPSNLRIFTTGIRTKLMFQVYAFGTTKPRSCSHTCAFAGNFACKSPKFCKQNQSSEPLHDFLFCFLEFGRRKSFFNTFVGSRFQGIYFDEDIYLDEFSNRFANARSDALVKDAGFFSFAASGRFSRAISLCMLRDITGEDMKEAFNVSLGERLRKFEHEIKAGEDETDPDDALHQFQSQFAGRKLTKGTRIVFVWDHRGRSLRTYIKGEPAGVVKSQLLNRCLWDVYCGESPIDKNAKILLAKTTFALASKKRQAALKAKL